jgi:hypothetical protein
MGIDILKDTDTNRDIIRERKRVRDREIDVQKEKRER